MIKNVYIHESMEKTNVPQMLHMLANSIDLNNCNASEEDLMEICDKISMAVNPEAKLSKYQAINYLGVSRATFDNYVDQGKIPKGRKQQGFKELFWYNKDLWKAKNEIDERKAGKEK